MEKKPKGKPRGRPITKENNAEYQARSKTAKALRKQVRQQLLQAVIDEGITKHIAEALKSRDLVHIQVVEKAMKLVGLDYASTEGLIANFEAKSSGDDKKPQATTVKFVLAKKPTEE